MILQAIMALLPPGKWEGGIEFKSGLKHLENETNAVIDNLKWQSTIDFTQPTKANSKWAKLLRVAQTEITQKLIFEKEASRSYFLKLLPEGVKFEEVDLFKAHVKNIPSEGFKSGDSIGSSTTNPTIELLETLKPAYVRFEYYNEANERIA